MHSSTSEVTGTRVRGLRRPKPAKNSPARAGAWETRARGRMVPFSEPTVEIRNISAATAAARVPRNVCTARAATEGASGQAVELALVPCQNGSAYRYAVLTAK